MKHARISCLNSSTANQNHDVSRDQDTSQSYHSNSECIWFVTQARGHEAPEGKCDKPDTLQIAMM